LNFKFSLKNAISEIIFLIKELNLSKLKTTNMKRNATAVWNGSLKEGAGKLTTQSTTLKDTQYSFKSRFEEGVGTNPEELVAAAHSGCFTMQLSAYITEGGFEIESIETKCDIELVEGTIITSHLTVNAKVKAITDEVFQQLVTKAEKNCPISKLLNAAISTTATLA
jgi:osmotically inducible protein OsmC